MENDDAQMGLAEEISIPINVPKTLSMILRGCV